MDAAILGHAHETVGLLLHLLFRYALRWRSVPGSPWSGEESLTLASHSYNLTRYGISRGEPGTAPDSCYTETKHHTHHLKNQEDKPMVVFLLKL